MISFYLAIVLMFKGVVTVVFILCIKGLRVLTYVQTFRNSQKVRVSPTLIFVTQASFIVLEGHSSSVN